MRPLAFVTCPVSPEALARLRRVARVRHHRGRLPIPRRELLRGLRDADGLLCLLTERIDADALAHAPRLRVVANCAVGYDNIDLAATAARDIVVTNTPDVLTETSADLAFALMLACARRIAEGDRLIRARRWRGWSPDLLIGTDVHGATLGVVGMGRIGEAVARRAAGFGMRVLYTRRQRGPRGPRDGRRVPLARLLAESDFVSVHVPLRAETVHLIGRRELARMKRTAILVNTSRGGVVDEAALIDALRTKRIAGAGLDVFAREPRVPRALRAMSNVVLTPHIASATAATRARMAALAAANLTAVLAGREPPNRVAVAAPPR